MTTVRSVHARALLATVALTSVLAVPQNPPADAQEGELLGLASTYVAQRVDTPDPQSNGRLGWLGIARGGDLNGDGADDALVPQLAGPGRVFVFSGSTGELIRTLDLPDAATSAEGSEGNFIYLTSLPDLGSCSGGQPTAACPSAVGPPDGAREVVVAASGVDVDGVVDIGAAYVMDGATGAMLKRVQMPPEDFASEATHAPKSFSFGRSSTSLDSPHVPDAPQAVRIGDIDGGGLPDFAVGNPTFFEDGPSTNPSCDPGPCAGSGRVYVFRGEDVAGSDPTVPLDDVHLVLKNPMSQTDPDPDSSQDHERFGHAVISIGDVGGCQSDPGSSMPCPDADVLDDPDGTPDIVVSAHATNHPEELVDSGVMWLFDGRTGAILRRYASPEPQGGALFGYHSGVMPESMGNLGAGAHPDLFAPAVAQSVEHAGQGRGWVLNGDFTTFRGTNILAQVDDPTPTPGGNFSAPSHGVGDVSGGPLNEVLVGTAGPLWPRDVDFIGDVHVYSPDAGEVVLSLRDPDAQPGSGFGNGVAPLGDVNDDGLLDFAVAAGLYDGAELNQGRLYIFRSTATPPVRRLAGGDRVGTAAAISEATFPDPAAVDTVVVASAADYPDGLAGAPLAAANGGPVLLTSPGGLDPAAAAEVQRLKPTRAFVLGGSAALSSAVDEGLRQAGVAEVTRLAGADRFATARLIADSVTAGAVARHVYIVEGADPDPGRGWPDAVSVAGLAAQQGRPILAVTTSSLPAATRQAVRDLEVEAATIIGGPAAVSEAVADALRAEGVQVNRLAGTTRYQTSTEVARFAVSAGADPALTWLATGRSFADALAAGPAVAAAGGVLHLLDGQDLDGSPPARDWVATRACDLTTVTLVGGEAAISERVAGEVAATVAAC